MFLFVCVLIIVGFIFGTIYSAVAYADRRTSAFPLWYCRLFKNRAELNKIEARFDSDGTFSSAVALLTWKPKDCKHKITTKVRTSYRNSFHVHEHEHDLDIMLDIPFGIQLGAWYHLNKQIALQDSMDRAKFYEKFAVENIDNQKK